MTKLTTTFILLVLSTNVYAQVYKVTYNINYIPNLKSGEVKSETGLLFIDKGVKSIYGTENFFKKDSIYALANQGKMSQYEAMAEMRERGLKTGFNSSVVKNYQNKSMTVSESILIDNYSYEQKNKLLWKLNPKTKKIGEYSCNSATTTYEGRVYMAWYTSEIPVSDGPYKFWGLPGLIISINDAENHFNFNLLSFEKYSENIPVNMNTGRKNIGTDFDTFKRVRTKTNQNRAEAMKSMGMDMSKITINGKRPTEKHMENMNRNVNYIER